MIRYEFGDGATDFVGEEHENLPPGKCKYFVIAVALNLSLIPDLVLLPDPVDGADEFVHVGVAVHFLPEDLAVVGVLAS
jgi:hypothetical protein